jgi:NADH kinase
MFFDFSLTPPYPTTSNAYTRHLINVHNCDVYWEDMPLEDGAASGIQTLDKINGPADLVIALGGDGTLLRASSFFPGKTPPVLSFAMGTLSFLLPHQFDSFGAVLARIFENRSMIVVPRMRLSYRIDNGIDDEVHTVSSLPVVSMNEVVIHRGASLHPMHYDIFINDHYLTSTVADGVIVSTPTGSTAYSVTAGGSMVAPTVRALALTAICPLSLSFRPILLPPNVKISLKMRSRTGKSDTAEAATYIDGVQGPHIFTGSTVHISAAEYPLYTVAQAGGTEDWLRSIRSLKWNQSFGPLAGEAPASIHDHDTDRSPGGPSWSEEA